MKRNNLVDLHCHILPEIDDGSPSMATSIELAHQAVADGIKYILATPHHMDRHYINHASAVRQAVIDFQTELDRQGIDLQVFPGQEVHLNGEMMTNLDDLLGIDEDRKYMLLELPHEMVPSYLDDVIFQLSCEGITPVIAHPERNARIIAEPEILYNLVKQGVLAQVTATSLVGTFGKQVQKTAKEFVRCGLVQVVASDAHVLNNREFAMTKAYQVLSEMDSDYSGQFAQNARDLLNGDDVSVETIEMPRKKRKFGLF
ncbi:CpsB/CapC family capsule biosynthesis tyrosine phosphatase [Lactiplantibacillus sp. WILCCON 0030]|uniref:Tyrosine-protein phosphatase n=1 Tax=Lactiplantibacillus brownii TaxID=3069269 RepID=A0ABU1A9U1_9LACO|nr:CpsB/CapC family capsule biosynthesis tyrosine phosphatase [Lactiplantibacillus brownii]MDQ7937742.1 CpsB/CapC family capsule biosynthesis tyrosine phosphatase [Lactiplantibacillus brownii]